jgi:hypothetical protein
VDWLIVPPSYIGDTSRALLDFDHPDDFDYFRRPVGCRCRKPQARGWSGDDRRKPPAARAHWERRSPAWACQNLASAAAMDPITFLP